jgi:integrase
MASAGGVVEVTTLRLEDLQLREGHWVIADLRGKGGHIRTIPVPQWVKEAVDSWTAGAGITSGPLTKQAKFGITALHPRSSGQS